MDIITYHASDMDLLQSDPMSFAVQVKHRNEYMGRPAQQAAIAADMRVFSGFSGGDVPYTKPGLLLIGLYRLCGLILCLFYWFSVFYMQC